MEKTKKPLTKGKKALIIILTIISAIILIIVGITVGKAVEKKNIESQMVPVGTSLGINYDSLEPTKQYLYERVYETIKNGDNKVYVSADENKIVSSLNSIVTDVFEDHPEFFWIQDDCNYNLVKNEDGDYDKEYEIVYFNYWNEIEDKQKEIDLVNNEVDKIVSLAKGLNTDYEKALFVHDYIVRNCEYDSDVEAIVNDESKTFDTPEEEQANSVYGVLINKKAICNGYSKTFQLLTQKLGLKTAYIIGHAGRNLESGHAWNCVNLDGENYYIDSTWDDTYIDDNNDKDFVSHAFFGTNTTNFEKCHSKDLMGTFNLKVTGEKYCYYKYTNKYIESYSPETLKEIINSQYDSGSIEFGFNSSKDFENAKEELDNNKAEYNVEDATIRYENLSLTIFIYNYK